MVMFATPRDVSLAFLVSFLSNYIPAPDSKTLLHTKICKVLGGKTSIQTPC